MKLQTLHDLFVLKIMALYDIESEIIKALPKMIKASTDTDLEQGFGDHFKETKKQLIRLEQIFKQLNLKPKKTKVEAIRGLVTDAEWSLKQDMPPAALDAALIASARYIEHYEMAGYLSAVVWAKLLGHNRIAELLEETLEEEKMADTTLAEVAEAKINQRALGDDDENEDEY